MLADGHGEGAFRPVESNCAFSTLVALHVRWLGNRLDARFPLNLRLEVEEHVLKIPSKPGF